MVPSVLVKRAETKQKYVHEVIDFVKHSGGIEYAISIMEKYHQKANDLLAELPDSTYKSSLSDLVQFTIQRTK